MHLAVHGVHKEALYCMPPSRSPSRITAVNWNYHINQAADTRLTHRHSKLSVHLSAGVAVITHLWHVLDEFANSP